MREVGASSASCSIAGTPELPGSGMSISTTSGRRSSTSSIASCALAASPTRSSPPPVSVCARAPRIICSSSTTTTVMGRGRCVESCWAGVVGIRRSPEIVYSEQSYPGAGGDNARGRNAGRCSGPLQPSNPEEARTGPPTRSERAIYRRAALRLACELTSPRLGCRRPPGCSKVSGRSQPCWGPSTERSTP